MAENERGHIRIPDWLAEDIHVSWDAKAVWGVCKRLTGVYAAYPSYETIGKMAGISRQRVLRAVDELEDKWLLEIRVTSRTGVEVNEHGFRSNTFITHTGTPGAFIPRSRQPGTKRWHASQKRLSNRATA
jgi:hypothetical protein